MTTTNYVKTALLLGLMTGLIVLCGGALGGRSGMVFALAVAAVMNLGSYWFSDKIVLAMYHAQPVSEAEAPRLYSIVQRLTARAGIPMPKLYVLPERAPNAFATGRNPSHAAVAVTAGLLEMMDDEELEGVLAHELGHVRNRDILISSIAATIAGAITMLASMARWAAIFGGVGGRDDRDGGGGGALGLHLHGDPGADRRRDHPDGGLPLARVRRRRHGRPPRRKPRGPRARPREARPRLASASP